MAIGVGEEKFARDAVADPLDAEFQLRDTCGAGEAGHCCVGVAKYISKIRCRSRFPFGELEGAGKVRETAESRMLLARRRLITVRPASDARRQTAELRTCRKIDPEASS